MAWSNWYKCIFYGMDSKVNTTPLDQLSLRCAGVYAIAGKDEYGYRVEYVGMSKSNIQARLKAHLTGSGSKVLKKKLEERRNGNEVMPLGDALYFAYVKTAPQEAQWMEALYVRGTVTLSNIQQQLSLPEPLKKLVESTKVELEP